jgi:hypothetical protein
LSFEICDLKSAAMHPLTELHAQVTAALTQFGVKLDLGSKPGEDYCIGPAYDPKKPYYPSVYLRDKKGDDYGQIPDTGTATVKYKVRSRTLRKNDDGERHSLDLELLTFEPEDTKDKKVKPKDGAATALGALEKLTTFAWRQIDENSGRRMGAGEQIASAVLPAVGADLGVKAAGAVAGRTAWGQRARKKFAQGGRVLLKSNAGVFGNPKTAMRKVTAAKGLLPGIRVAAAGLGTGWIAGKAASGALSRHLDKRADARGDVFRKPQRPTTSMSARVMLTELSQIVHKFDAAYTGVDETRIHSPEGRFKVFTPRKGKGVVSHLKRNAGGYAGLGLGTAAGAAMAAETHNPGLLLAGSVVGGALGKQIDSFREGRFLKKNLRAKGYEPSSFSLPPSSFAFDDRQRDAQGEYASEKNDVPDPATMHAAYGPKPGAAAPPVKMSLAQKAAALKVQGLRFKV